MWIAEFGIPHSPPRIPHLIHSAFNISNSEFVKNRGAQGNVERRVSCLGGLDCEIHSHALLKVSLLDDPRQRWQSF